MSQSWEWVPNRRLGPFELGVPISHYVERFGAVREPDDPDRSPLEDWISYSLPGSDAYLCAEDDLLVSVTAHADVSFQGTELIGLTLAELERVLGCKADETGEPVLYDDGDIQTPHDFFDHGLQVWTRDGRVISLSCLG